MRIILVGSSRAGKSTTGNLLLNPASPRAPFVVSNSINSCTNKLHQVTSPVTHLTVVDTPGLGDSPAKDPKESDAHYKARCNDNSDKYFTDITTDLRNHGGMIVFVQQAAQVSNKARRHLEALSRVLHDTFSSSVVLLLTNVPEDFRYGPDHDPSIKRQRNAKLCDWLQATEQEIKDKYGFKFAASLAFCNSMMIDPMHPTHAQSVLQSLRQLHCELRVGLAPGVAMVWHDLVTYMENLARMVEDKTAAINALEVSIGQNNSQLATLRKEAKDSADAVITGAAIAGAEPLGWLFMVPGLAAGIGGLIAGIAGGAKAVQDAKIKTLEAHLHNQRASLEQHKGQLAAAKGKSAAQLRKEAQEIQALVLSD